MSYEEDLFNAIEDVIIDGLGDDYIISIELCKSNASVYLRRGMSKVRVYGDGIAAAILEAIHKSHEPEKW